MTTILNLLPQRDRLAAIDAMDRTAWLAERRTGIGGSDVAGILGLSPWATPYSVWRRKVGLDADTPPSWQMRIGTSLEATIADAWAESTGATLLPVPFLRDRDAPHRVASLDRLVLRPNHDPRVGEVKWSAKGWSAVPEAYWCQVVWYMALTGLRGADVIAATPWQEPTAFPIAFDDETAGLMLEEADRFWCDHVVGNVPPEPVNAEERKAYWLGRVPREASVVAAPSDLEATARDLLAAREASKAADALLTELEATLLAGMARAGATRVVGQGWGAAVIDRQGSISYAKAVKSLGIASAALEPFRGTASRYVRIAADKED